jgi:hypothetical protein
MLLPWKQRLHCDYLSADHCHLILLCASIPKPERLLLLLFAGHYQEYITLLSSLLSAIRSLLFPDRLVGKKSFRLNETRVCKKDLGSNPIGNATASPKKE